MFLLFLIPSILGSPESDAKSLNDALYGIPNGFNESTLITVIYEKKFMERQKMMESFRRVYGENAYSDLCNKIAYAPEDITMGIIDNSSAYYDAKVLIRAMYGWWYERDPVFEIMISRTSQEIREIKKASYGLGTDLCDRLNWKTIGDLNDVMVLLCKADRNEDNWYDVDLALKDCDKLYQFGPRRMLDTDEYGINHILFKRNYEQLRVMFRVFSNYVFTYLWKDEYITLEKRSIETMIREEYSFDTEVALLEYVKVVKNRIGYFASLIRKGLTDGAGSQGERRVIRTIFGRAGIDLPEIVKEFGGKNELVEAIQKSADLYWFTKQALIAVLNANCEQC
ncbi:unnamed protein product [Caenorhabditis angaria]|uniref:Uncharacterized protein n=1 Tax=Caenorhabditis angaria TaxID=860376 RepID=A0A9P1MVK8_9PELO|nr:unnamed protein product [Caenorhabditis angaria]